MKYFALLLFLPLFLFPRVSHAQIITNEKLITVDTTKQRLYVWDAGKLQREVVVSTGMQYTPTVKGSFKIYKKIEKQDMRGYFPPYKPYFIKNVPHVMYFYGAYALHGTFWHSKFGTRNSHGCVNLSIADAQWIYAWSDVGTRVEVF